MLLTHHVEYSKIAVSGFNFHSQYEREEVIIGATANDLCELTNEYQHRPLPTKDEIYGIATSKRMMNWCALYQSHYGNLTSLHAMSKKLDEPASTTKDELVKWFEFLNDVALDNKIIEPKNEIASDSVQISDMFNGKTITYCQIFDADGHFTIKYRALGMMLHLIQDVYTPCHCERNDNNEVVKFLCYKPQDKAKHKLADDVAPAQRDSLLEQCKTCLQSILNRDRYNYDKILSLSTDAQNSDGGVFV